MAIKNVFFIFIIFTPVVLFSAGVKTDFSIYTSQQSGDTGVPFSVTVSTSQITHLYDPTDSGLVDREILFQNVSEDYVIVCSTSSTGFTFTSGNRFLLPKFPTGFTTNGVYDVWCLADPAAGGSGVEVVGVVENDSKDR